MGQASTPGEFSVSVLPMAESAAAIAALPQPVVHLKGFANRLLLAGAANPTH
jgi:hypothetical protein